MNREMIECELCFTYTRGEYYQPEWSDIPTKIFYSCRCGAVEWSEDLTAEQEAEFMGEDNDNT